MQLHEKNNFQSEWMTILNFDFKITNRDRYYAKLWWLDYVQGLSLGQSDPMKNFTEFQIVIDKLLNEIPKLNKDLDFKKNHVFLEIVRKKTDQSISLISNSKFSLGMN
jgi:hypothetical protein